jgi:hypothetical protein
MNSQVIWCRRNIVEDNKVSIWQTHSQYHTEQAKAETRKIFTFTTPIQVSIWSLIQGKKKK